MGEVNGAGKGGIESLQSRYAEEARKEAQRENPTLPHGSRSGVHRSLAEVGARRVALKALVSTRLFFAAGAPKPSLSASLPDISHQRTLSPSGLPP